MLLIYFLVTFLLVQPILYILKHYFYYQDASDGVFITMTAFFIGFFWILHITIHDAIVNANIYINKEKKESESE